MIVTFITDFGLDDTFVGVCHAVLLEQAPHARVVDLGHAVPRGDVRVGSAMLARAVVRCPVAVHLAVVDPGVGSERLGVALTTARGDVLVGPDNGLLVEAAEELGGITGAFALPVPPGSSATFHGRDVFAPAAGRLAAGVRPGAIGPPVDDLVRPPPRVLEERDGVVRTEVVLIDRFGNVQLSARPAHLSGADRIAIGERTVIPVAVTFSDLDQGELGCYADSDGYVALAVNGGSAAERLGIASGAVLELRPLT